MATKKPIPSPPPSLPPTIHEANLGNNGAVAKGKQLTFPEAVAARKAGRDVVICGAELGANRRLAGQIEHSANGKSKRCPPHLTAGVHALPHYQPDPRPPHGHTFYETPNRKAF